MKFIKNIFKKLAIKLLQDTVFPTEWEFVDLPDPETPVLVVVDGFDSPLVLQMLWDTCNPMVEPYYADFLYWASVEDNGTDYGDNIVCWMSLPEMPHTKINS